MITARIVPQELAVSVGAAKNEIQIGNPIAREYVERPAYAGPYTVTPSDEAQVLHTDELRMTGDVTVNPIPSNLQSKSVTPTKSQQSITPDSGYNGLSDVTVEAIPEAYQNVSGVTAAAADVLAPKVIVDATGASVPGKMPNVGSVNKTLDATSNNQTYTVPAGKHSGSGTVQIVLENKSATPSTSDQDITPTMGKVLGKVTVTAMPTGTEGTPTATKGTVSNHSVTVTPSVTNSAGYISGGSKTGTAATVTAAELVSGSQTVTQNGAVDCTNLAEIVVAVEGSGGITPIGNINITQAGQTDVTNYATATVAQGEVAVNSNEGYYTENGNIKWHYQPKAGINAGEGDGAPGYLANFLAFGTDHVFNAIPSNTTITPTTSPQTIGGANYMMAGPVTVAAMPTGTEGTPTATKGAVSNHSVTVTPSVTNGAGYIDGGTKTGNGVTVSASELVSGSETKTENGTYDVTNLAQIVVDVQGGSSGMTVATASTTPSTASSSIQFTGLSGEPTSFVVISAADLATGASPYKTAAVVFDGTNLHGQIVTNTNNAQASYDNSFTKSYSNGTLTITGSGTNFQPNQYKLIYTYGGNSANLGTAETQVGSGATSVTFTGLTDEPDYFSVIFKSNFGTSSGYQRVISVVYDGTNTYGLAMDSGAKALSSWSYTYNNGTLTVSSVGTNNGGYFHQPGYYQLTYGVGGTVEPVEIEVEPLSVNTNGTYTAPEGKAYSPVTVNVASGSSKNVQVVQSTSRTTSTTLAKVSGEITVSKTGTYNIYWSACRTNTSSSYTWGTRMYIGNTAYGTENTTWSNNTQNNHLTNVALTADDVISVYARGRGGNYYAMVPMLLIIES